MNLSFGSSFGAPGRARTCDLLIRSQTLYPTELRVPEERVNGKLCMVKSKSWRRAFIPFTIDHSPFTCFGIPS